LHLLLRLKALQDLPPCHLARPTMLLNTVPHSHLLALVKQTINTVLKIKSQADILYEVQSMIED
jgi:hypothetical protein